MDTNFENRVRERAYEIWQSAGRTHGMAHEHWLMAERVVANESGMPVVAAKSAAPKTVAKKTAPKLSPKKPSVKKESKVAKSATH